MEYMDGNFDQSVRFSGLSDSFVGPESALDLKTFYITIFFDGGVNGVKAGGATITNMEFVAEKPAE